MKAKPTKEDIKNTLKNSGVRPTRQRVTVYESILLKRDHPTADEIFTRARKKLPSISFATVYNCLETLTQSSLVKQIVFDRSSSRYCPNLSPHAHFKCSESGKIFDLELDESLVDSIRQSLPDHYSSDNFELTFTGTFNSSN
jgi:Fur family peroxide stress response transcriptional regulator